MVHARAVDPKLRSTSLFALLASTGCGQDALSAGNPAARADGGPDAHELVFTDAALVDACSTSRRDGCAAYGCGCLNEQCSGGYCPTLSDSCSDSMRNACGAYGCGCQNNDCSGGYCASSTDGCTQVQRDGCGNYGCGCFSGQCSGVYCAEVLPGAIAIPTTPDVAAERKNLLAGVSSFSLPTGNVPGKLALFDARAFPVIVEDGAPLVVASSTNSGRAVAFAHDAFFSAGGLADASNAQLVANAVHWAAHQKPGLKVAVHNNDALATFLASRQFAVTRINAMTPANLTGVDVVAFMPYTFGAADEVNALQAFSMNGGGLLAAGMGWPFEGDLATFPGNQALNPVGIGFTRAYASAGPYDVTSTPPATTNAVYAYNYLQSLALGAGTRATVGPMIQAVSEVIPLLPAGATLRLYLEQLMKVTRGIVPSNAPGQEWNTTRDPFRTLGIMYLLQRPATLADIKAHPAGDDFPGKVATTSRISETLTLDGNIEDWQSTGLYAAPGEQITVDLSSASAVGKLSVQIGAHEDLLWDHEVWTRMPQLTRSFALAQTTTTAANEFGGLVYIKVPRGSALGPVTLTIGNVVAAPYYTPGMTAATWAQVRNNPAPWAEIQSNKLILTVESSLIRDLADPSVVTQFWDKVLATHAELSPLRAEYTKSPLRAIFDRDISVGYMHAGYPIMGMLPTEPDTVDIPVMLSAPSKPWGMFHELGHNHQNDDWVMDDTVEVNVNLFTMYSIEKVTSYTRDQAVSELTGYTLFKHMCHYFHPAPATTPSNVLTPGSYEHWTKDPFAALSFYGQLIDLFGWDKLKTVLAGYLSAPNSDNLSNGQKWDSWLGRYSTAVNHNLAPMFDAWKLPITATGRSAVANLPALAWAPPTSAACQ